MPELPEVECMVRKFRPLVSGLEILDFSASWPRQVNPSIVKVRRSIRGKVITRLGRRGKYMVFHLDDGTHFLVHLGMSGRLEWSRASGEQPAHVRAEWRFKGRARMLFCDARKFGKIRHTSQLQEDLAHLGPEPLAPGFTVACLQKELQGYARQLKPLLLEQSAVAGLGNIYTDEALFRARLHPLVCSSSLDRRQIARLHRAIQAVLKQGIRFCGTSIDWVYPGGRMQTRLKVYRRTGEPCPRCGASILRILVGQRSTHYCPVCQPGEHLARKIGRNRQSKSSSKQ
jgi:formamidopyrimidine-DNA glycosylase